MNVTKIDTLLANRLGKAVVEFPAIMLATSVTPEHSPSS